MTSIRRTSLNDNIGHTRLHKVYVVYRGVEMVTCDEVHENCQTMMVLWKNTWQITCLFRLAGISMEMAKDGGDGWIWTCQSLKDDHCSTLWLCKNGTKTASKTNENPLFLRCSSVVPPNQSRWSSVPKSVWLRFFGQNRAFFTEFGSDL